MANNKPLSSDERPLDLIGTAEAAKLIQASLWTIYRYIRSGHLPAWRRVGRIFVSREDVLSLVQKYEPPEPAVKIETPRERRLREQWTNSVLKEAGLM